MSDIEMFEEFFEDVQKQKMSIHAFGMFCGGVIKKQNSELEALKQPKTCDGCEFEDGIYIPSHCILCSRDKRDHYEKKPTNGE